MNEETQKDGECCPKCGSRDIQSSHSFSNAMSADVYYIECLECEHQWDHT